METFDHINFLSEFAKWIKPNLYVEFCTRNSANIISMAPYCKIVHGIDCEPIHLNPSIENVQLFIMTTDEYVQTILNAVGQQHVIDMAFIDADHASIQAFKDFEGIFPYVIEDGFIFLHDTYPFNVMMTRPDYCNDSYKVPYMIREKYQNKCEVVTLPFNPGLTIVKKKISNKPGFLM